MFAAGMPHRHHSHCECFGRHVCGIFVTPMCRAQPQQQQQPQQPAADKSAQVAALKKREAELSRVIEGLQLKLAEGMRERHLLRSWKADATAKLEGAAARCRD